MNNDRAESDRAEHHSFPAPLDIVPDDPAVDGFETMAVWPISTVRECLAR